MAVGQQSWQVAINIEIYMFSGINSRKQHRSTCIEDTLVSLSYEVAGTFVPKNFRSRERKFHRVELSFPGTFAHRNESSMELSFLGTFAAWNFRSLELSLSGLSC